MRPRSPGSAPPSASACWKRARASSMAPRSKAKPASVFSASPASTWSPISARSRGSARKLLGGLPLVPVVMQHGKAAERLRFHSRHRPRGRLVHRRAVAVECLGDGPRALVGAGLMQGLRRAMEAWGRRPPRGGARSASELNVYQATAYREKCRISPVTVLFLRLSSDGISSRMRSSSSVYTTRLSSSSGEQFA